MEGKVARMSEQTTTANQAPQVRASFATMAPWLFVLLWSTGFIGARYGLPYIEPFTFLAIRFAIAAALLAGIAVTLRSPWPRRAQVRHAAVTGLLLHAGYLGGVFFAVDRGMSAGMSALIVSLQPVLTAVIGQATLGEGVSRRQWAGLALGLVGVILVVGEKLLQPGAGNAGVSAATLTAAMIALACTTVGTLYQKRHGGGIPLLGGTAIQYVAAGSVVLLLSLTVETRAIIWAPQLFFAMAWLVLVLSLGAILLLMLLLRLNSAASVASLFYLVPPATAIEAYLLFGERLGPLALLGLALASLGVALVVVPRP